MPVTARATNALLSAITADPSNDTPRLAYADYLEEQGDPERAEFIRTQVTLARLSRWDRQAKLLRLQERLLLIRNGERWRAQLPTIAGVQWGRFERGFVAEVTVEDVKTLAKRVDAIREAAPIGGVRLLSLEGIGGRSLKDYPWLVSLRLGSTAQSGAGIAPLLASPLSLHLTRLEFGDGVVLSGDAARDLAAATQLTRLRELGFSVGALGDGGAATLAQAKHLSGLRALRIRLSASGGGATVDPLVSTTGLRALAGSPYLKNLTELNLGPQRFTDESARVLFSGPAFVKLQTISLAGSALTPRAFDVSATAGRLASVDLSQCVIGDSSLAAMVALPQFSEVASLNLRSCELSPRGVAALAKSAAHSTLAELNLADNPLRTHGLDAFCHARWPELHTLNLARCGLGPESVKVLAAASGIKRLLELDLSGNDVGAGGAIAITKALWANTLVRLNLARCHCAAGAVLAASPRLRHIQQLDLTDNPLNSAGVTALTEGAWHELTDLQLAGTNAGDVGAMAIVRSPSLPKLVTLGLAHCGLTPAGLEVLLGLRGPGVSDEATTLAARLVQLDLSNNTELGDEAARQLSLAKLPALRFLSLRNTGLTEHGLNILRSGPLAERLSQLECSGNTILAHEQLQVSSAVRIPLSPDWEATGFSAG